MINIEVFRKEKRLSQEEVANYIGTTRQTFSKLEKGNIEPTLGQAVKLAELFNKDIDNFIDSDVKIESNKVVDWEKYKQIITNFIKFGADKDGKITKTKLAKLCYLLDFSWYYFNLEPITGLEYRKYEQGPVPDAFFGTIEELLNEEAISLQIKGKAFLIENIGEPNTDKLSEDELDLLKKIALKWRGKQTSKIVEFTHKQLPWTICYNKEIIPYSLISQEDFENVY